MSEGLKPCPFCGNKGTPIMEEDNMSHVHCLSCGAKGPPTAISYEAIKEWNTRKEPK